MLSGCRAAGCGDGHAEALRRSASSCHRARCGPSGRGDMTPLVPPPPLPLRQSRGAEEEAAPSLLVLLTVTRSCGSARPRFGFGIGLQPSRARLPFGDSPPLTAAGAPLP
ncbi:hypothetical protein FQA47_020809 [Oryzias melastigma]|uniref:Uncharacterized protein n=1 Tax=Oryzias melastigma TaxID=30732 RepID=A0A834CM04_ORYME|nr:hypothetical protein FQA47_020809 [Oryzias melastigma]